MANNYLKNVMKSVAYAAADVAGDYVPDIKDFTSSNKEFGTAVYRTIKNPTASLKRSFKLMQESKVYKALDYGVRNLAEDLRTGNFYNKERKDRDELKFSGLDTNWDDLSEYGIDKDWESKVSSNSTEDISAGDREIISSIEGSNAALASATVNAVIASSQNEIKNSRINTSMLYTQNEKLFGVMHKDMTVLGSTMQQMYKLQAASLQNIDNNMSQFFTQESKLNTERNAILKEMLELQRSIYKGSANKEKEAANKKSSRVRWADINNNGMVNLSAYFDAIKKNISNQLASTMPAGFGEDSNMLAVMMTSPLEGVMKYVVNGLIPGTVKAAAKGLNDTVSGVFGNIIGELGNARGKDGILGMLSKFLGISTSVDRNIDNSRYEKGPIPFDGITRKAIIDVIPKYLRKIEAVLTGRPEEVFDYRSGRWMKVSDIRKQYDDIKKSAVRRASSELMDVMNPGLQSVRRGITNKTDRDSWDKAIDEFQQFLYDNNGRFNPKVSASRNGIDSGNYPNLYRHYSKIKTIYKDFDRIESKDSKGNTITRHTKYSTRLGVSKSVLDTKAAEDAQYRAIESEVGNVIQHIFGIDPKSIDSHGKQKSRGFESYNILKDTTDKSGNSIFDYLQNIDKGLAWLCANGFPGSGGSTLIGPPRNMSNVHTNLNTVGSTNNTSSNTESENEKIRRQALEAIESGKAIDLRVFNDDEVAYLLSLSSMLSNNAITEYKSEVEGYNSSKLARFIDKHFVKTNIRTMKDVEEAIKKADKEGVNTNEVNMDAKEEKFFNKIMKRISTGGSILGGVVGASGEAFTNLLYAADKAIYEMMYKSEIEDDKGGRKKYNGFLDAMVGKMTDKFKELSEWVKENIFEPFKNRFGFSDDTKDRFNKSIKDIGSKIWTAFVDSNKSVYGPLADSISTSFQKKSIARKLKTKYDNKKKENENPDKLATVFRRESRARAIHGGTDNILNWGKENDFYSDDEHELEDKLLEANLITKGELDLIRLNMYDKDGNFNLDNYRAALTKRYLRNQAKLHAKGTPSGRPFRGITTLTKGEGYISGSGMGVVPKTGVYNITSPTHIINRKDMASLNGRSLSNASLQHDLGKEKLAAKRAGFTVAHHEAGTDSVQITNNANIDTKEILKEAKNYIPEAAGGGLIGGILSMVLGLAGGPLIGAALGAGASIISGSGSIKEKLFGKAGEDGKADGSGIVPKSIVKAFNRYFPDMTKYGMAGIIPGLITPLGPIGGLMAGAAFGFLKNNERFTNKYFGEEGELHIGSEEKKIIEKLLPGAGIGAGAGVVLGTLFGGPFGLLGNAALGAGLGMLGTTEEFKNLLLGEEINGERVGGILGSFAEALKPLTDSVRNIGTKLSNSIDKNIIAPIANFVKPSIHAVPIYLGGIAKRIAKIFTPKDKIGPDGTTKALFGSETLAKLVGGVGTLGSGLIGATFGLPGKIINGIGNDLREYDIRHGDMVGMTQKQAVEFMDGRGAKVSSYLRASSKVGSGLKGSLNLDEAKKVKDILYRMNDTEGDAKKNLTKRNSELNKFLTGYKLSGGRKLSKYQITEILKAADSKDYTAISDILQNNHLVGSADGMSKAEFNQMMNEDGLKKHIINAVEAKERLKNIKDININDKEIPNDLKESLIKMGLSKDDVKNLFGKNGKENRKVFANLLSDQIEHLDAKKPEEIKHRMESDNHKNIENITSTLQNMLELMIAKQKGDTKEIEKVVSKASYNLDRGQTKANKDFDKEIEKTKKKKGEDFQNIKHPEKLTPWKGKLNSRLINIIDGSSDIESTARLEKLFSNSKILDIQDRFDEEAIVAISGVDDATCKNIINALTDKFIHKTILRTEFLITKETIEFLCGVTTEREVKELSKKCEFLDQVYTKTKNPEIYLEYDSLQDIFNKVDIDKMSDMREESGVKSGSKTSSWFTNLKKKIGIIPKKIGRGLKKGLRFGLKTGIGLKLATALLPGTPLPYLAAAGYLGYKGVKGGVNLARHYKDATKRAPVKFMDFLLGRNTPPEEQEELYDGQDPEELTEETPAEDNAYGTIAMNGLGTFLLSAGKTAWNVAKGVAKGAGKLAKSLFNRKKNKGAGGEEAQKAGLLSSLLSGIGNKLFHTGGSESSGNFDETGKKNDGVDELHVGGGKVMTFKRRSDGHIEPDTSNSNTKSVLNELNLKEKSAEQAQAAQIESAELIKKTFDTSDVKGSKGGKLGWFSLLLAGGVLWKSGVLKRIFDGVIKPLWTDTVKPWIDSTAMPWLKDTALPALKDVFSSGINLLLDKLPTILGTAVGTLIKNLPQVIWNGIKGITKFAGAVLDTVLGNPTNVGAETTVSGNNLSAKYGEDYVTGMYDENGNALTAKQIDSGDYKYIYNAEGTQGIVNGDGTVTFEDPSRPGSGYVQVVGKSALRSFGRAAATGKTSRLLSGANRFSNFLIRNSSKVPGRFGKFLTKTTGRVGKVITKPLGFAENLGLKYRTWTNGRVESVADNMLNRAIAEGDDEAIEAIIKGNGSKSTKITQKVFGTKNTINGTKEAAEKTIKESAEKAGKEMVEKTGKNVVKETGEKVVKSTVKNADNVAKSGIGAKLAAKAKDIIGKLFSNPKVKEKLASAAKFLHVDNVGAWINKFKGSIDNIFAESMEQGVKKVGTSTTKQVLSKAVAIAFLIADFIAGADQAESLLGVTETNIFDELIAGLMNALCNFLIIPSIFPGVNKILQSIYKLIPGDFEERQAQATKEYEEYVEKTGSTMTKEEYLKQKYSVTGKVDMFIKNTWKKVMKGAEKTGGKIYDALHGGDPLEKLEKKRQKNRKKGIYTVDNLEPDELLAVRDYRKATGANLEDAIQAVMVDGKRAPATTTTNATGTLSLPNVNTSDVLSNILGIESIDGEFNFRELNRTLDKAKNGKIDITSKLYWKESNKEDGTIKGTLGSAYEKISKLMNLPVLMVRKSLEGLSGGIEEISDAITDDDTDSSEGSGKKKKSLKGFISSTIKKIKNFFSSGSGTGYYKYGTGRYSKQIDPCIAGMPFNASYDKNRQTIGDSGCGPAAAVNALESMYGRGNAVVSAANYAIKRGYKEANGGTKPGFFSDYFSMNGLDSQTSYNRSDIERNINSGMPTVIMGSNPKGVSSSSPFGANPHYVTVTGTDGKGNAIVQDPESKYDNQLYPLKSLMKNTTLGISAYGRGSRNINRLYPSRNRSISLRNVYGTGSRYKYGRGDDSQFIWSYLKRMGMTDAGAAGMMGNLKAESDLKSYYVEKAALNYNRMTHEEYTAAVDNGSITKEQFLHPRGGETKNGYGLAQWTSIGRKEGLYNYAKQKGVSISDVAMQLEYLAMELSTGYKNVWNVLTTTKSLAEASDIVLTQFEKPADQSNAVKIKRRKYGKEYLDKFGSDSTTMLGYDSNSISSNTSSYTSSNTKSGLAFVNEDYKTDDTEINENSSLSDVLNYGANKLSKLFSSLNVTEALNIFTNAFSSDKINWFNRDKLFNVTESTLKSSDDTDAYNTNIWDTSYNGEKVTGAQDIYPQRMVELAKKELADGVQENPLGSDDVKYNDWYYGKDNKDKKQPWCAAFISWLAHEAGVPGDIIPKFAYTPTGKNYFDQHGVPIDNEYKPGDLIFTYSDKKKRISHTGLVVDKNLGKLITIEGNYSDRVKQVERDPNDKNLYVVRPNYGLHGTGTGNKPLSRYGQFKNSINSNITNKNISSNSTNTIRYERRRPSSGSGTVRYGMAANVAPDYSKFITAIISILTTIADNTDKLNLIVSILNNKLNLNISASDVSNATGDKQSLKSKLTDALSIANSTASKFNSYSNTIEDNSMNYIISAMNAIASE